MPELCLHKDSPPATSQRCGLEHPRIVLLTNVIPPYHKPLLDRLARKYAVSSRFTVDVHGEPPALAPGMGGTGRCRSENNHAPSQVATSERIQRAALCPPAA